MLILMGGGKKSVAMADTSPGDVGVRKGPLGERWPDSKFSFQLPQLLAPESQKIDGLADAFC